MKIPVCSYGQPKHPFHCCIKQGSQVSQETELPCVASLAFQQQAQWRYLLCALFLPPFSTTGQDCKMNYEAESAEEPESIDSSGNQDNYSGILEAEKNGWPDFRNEAISVLDLHQLM